MLTPLGSKSHFPLKPKLKKILIYRTMTFPGSLNHAQLDTSHVYINTVLSCKMLDLGFILLFFVWRQTFLCRQHKHTQLSVRYEAFLDCPCFPPLTLLPPFPHIALHGFASPHWWGWTSDWAVASLPFLSVFQSCSMSSTSGSVEGLTLRHSSQVTLGCFKLTINAN